MARYWDVHIDGRYKTTVKAICKSHVKEYLYKRLKSTTIYSGIYWRHIRITERNV